jgi:hypothetical protein
MKEAVQISKKDWMGLREKESYAVFMESFI